MSKIWIISDYHFNHKRIIQYCDRPFSNVNHMNNEMIKRWKNTVSNKDKIFVLGDIGFGTTDEMIRLMKGLTGYKILVRGNHDKSFNDGALMKMGFSEIYKYPIILEEKYILSHYPLEAVVGSNMVNIHGHIHDKTTEHSEQYNVCVEHHNYTPINFKKIKELYNETNIRTTNKS